MFNIHIIYIALVRHRPFIQQICSTRWCQNNIRKYVVVCVSLKFSVLEKSAATLICMDYFSNLFWRLVNVWMNWCTYVYYAYVILVYFSIVNTSTYFQSIYYNVIGIELDFDVHLGHKLKLGLDNQIKWNKTKNWTWLGSFWHTLIDIQEQHEQ